MTHPSPEADHRVVPFRRPAHGVPVRHAAAPRRSDEPPIPDLRRYEQDSRSDDYRQRMVINVVGFSFVVFLITAGIWIVSTLADIRAKQDCFLSGQRNCAHITAAPSTRY